MLTNHVSTRKTKSDKQLQYCQHFNTFPEQVLILTIAESRLEPLNLPRLDCHDQDEPNTAGEQRGQQEVGDGPERDHSRHLGQSWMRNLGSILRTGI